MHRVDLGLGRCSPDELPAWIARAAKQLRVTWHAHAIHSHLRGRNRDTVVRWLSSGVA